MLQRIVSIRNVGRFRRCAAVGDVTFRRFTLIFAENGRGKTTLCAILRSLCTNKPGVVIGRTTLDSTDRPEVQLLIGNTNIAFRKGAWSAPYPEIAVFDGTYVSDNVFAGDVVATDQRRNLYRVIIGAQGVTLAARLNELDNQIRHKNEDIRFNRANMQRHVPSGMTIDAFIALREDAQINARITAREQELQAVRRATQLQQRPALSPVAVPVFPAAFAELLAKTFATVAADAERRVTEHIARHRMQTRGEPWLTEGLRYVAAEACPFCGQDLAGVDLIQAYRSFFTREYHALRDEVTGLSGQVEAAIGERVSATIEQTILPNSNGVEFWQQYCDVAPLPSLEAGRVGEVMKGLRQAAQALLQKKAGTPLDAVPPDEEFTRALGAFEALRTSLGTYNAAVATGNAVITARKQATQAANAGDVERALERLKAQKARHTAEVKELCATDTRFQGEKAGLEAEKGKVRQRLDAHTEQVITRYGETINRYLERINAGFRITTPTHTYRGGPPSTSYQIIINQRAVDLGDAATPAELPSFRNTLSAGDRSTLALAFFLAQLEQDAGRAGKIVVFDDPFTSLDSFRRSHTVNQLYRCGETSAQVVLLSHEPTFLKLLWDRVQPADRKTLQFGRVGEDNTMIAEWDIEKALQARYRADLDTLQKFFSLGEGEQRDVIQKIRPVLEGYCRTLYPTQFGEQEMMGSIVGKIQEAGAAHPLHPIVEDLDELNVYCRRYHHAENPGTAATEPIDDVELQDYVRRTLRLVGCLL
jgi:wobble nucleotide-excising tRNase